MTDFTRPGLPKMRYRFGVFEADSTTGELRRQGVRIKLHSQPFQVLFLLLERPGELLTREEICRELWPDGTFVDYEHGVNSAVNRLREALGDKASHPRFIETLARRGYRFVAPVERIALQEDSDRRAWAQISEEPAAVPADVEDRDFSTGFIQPGGFAEELASRRADAFRSAAADVPGLLCRSAGNLAEIRELFSALPHPTQVFTVLIVTAALLIPVRTFLLCAVLFRAPGTARKVPEALAVLLPLDMCGLSLPFCCCITSITGWRWRA